MSKLLRPSLSWLLVFVPAAWALEHFAAERHTWIFFTAAVAIVPLAGWMGKATEHLAEKTGEGIGGLLNATFGNAAELIIAIVALQKGMTEVVKASLTGSIIGNILLVLGAAFLSGGLRFKSQRFNETAARSQTTMMTLAAVSLIMPAAYHYIAGGSSPILEERLSFDISWILLATYACGLLFSLHTHKRLFIGQAAEAAQLGDETPRNHRPWPLSKSLGILAVATAAVAWMSEILVGAVEPAAEALGMSRIFIGVVVVAIVGNAAEHSTAILMAMKNRMDLSIAIAVGSSVQIALFVAPILVILSHFVGGRPLDLVFTPAEVVAVGMSVFVASQVVGDGESNWLEGVQLLAVYAVLGVVFYFLP